MTFNDTWPTATVNDGERDDRTPPPEGDYDVALVDAGAFTAKSGNDIVKLGLRVIGGLSNGHEWTELRNFKSQGAANATKTTCARLGVPVEGVSSLAELNDRLKEIVGQYFEVTVQRNGEYLNTYINGPAIPDVPINEPEPIAVGSDPSPGDDDIPF